ncbi:MAG TPA: FecR family protein [Methylomirabilota bacterium]|nr:FecR family protein [Methylomirabilota bacterium]
MSHALLRVLLLSAVALAALPASISAQISTRLGVVTTLVGDATIARPAGAPRAIKFKDEVFPGDTIRTADGALVRVLVRGSTLVAIGQTSTASLVADAARSTVRLDAGSVSLVVRGEKPAPLDVVTPQGTASARGTAFAVFYMDKTLHVHVTEGSVTLRPSQSAGVIELKLLQSVSVAADGKVGPVVAMTREQADSLMKDFRLVPAHPDAPSETVKALGERGASEAEKEAKALRDQGVRGLPRTDDPSRRPVVPIQPDVRPSQTPKACC